MQDRIDRPEEYEDIATKCVEKFRSKNAGRCMVILSKEDEIHDNQKNGGRPQRLLRCSVG